MYFLIPAPSFEELARNAGEDKTSSVSAFSRSSFPRGEGRRAAGGHFFALSGYFLGLPNRPSRYAPMYSMQ